MNINTTNIARLVQAAAVLLLTAFVAGGAARADAADLKLETYVDPQFSVPVPAGWHLTEAVWVAERLFVATPEDVTAEELLSSDGVDVGALVQVKVDSLDQRLQQVPPSDLGESVITRYQQTFAEAKLPFAVTSKGTVEVDGTKGFQIVSEQDDMIDHVLLIPHGSYLYEIKVAYKQALAERYGGFFGAVKGGVKFSSVGVPDDLKRRKTILTSVPMPADWHVTEVEGEIPRVHITKEKLGETAARTWTGATFIKIQKYRNRFNIDSENPSAVYSKWSETYLSRLEGSQVRILYAGTFKRKGELSYLLEVSFRDAESGEFVQLINISTAKDGDFYNATFEAPVRRFFAYRPMFLHAVQELDWR